MILFITPNAKYATGGVKVMYRMVDILNAHGIESAILHTQKGFRCSWFKNNTRIEYYTPELVDKAQILVVPENLGDTIHEVVHQQAKNLFGNHKIISINTAGKPKVILNQNGFYTFAKYGFPPQGSTPYLHHEVLATLTVSEHSKEFLQRTFPTATIRRFRLSINNQIFYADSREKQKQIAFMPRKNNEEVHTILHSLFHRGALAHDWKLVPIDNMDELDVAETLRNSAIFLSVGTKEGFGLPPAEAMACGCITVGYHGFGGKEFMLPDFSFPIQVGDVAACANALQNVISLFQTDLELIQTMSRKASEFILQTYSAQYEEQDVLDFWNEILHR